MAVAALRFWTHDIWEPGWNRERRRQMIKHYWSYLRHEAVSPEYLPASNVTDDRRQRAFAAAYARAVLTTQRASARRGVRLTFRPLGKNLRLLGTAVRDHVSAGCATVIEADGHADEMVQLAADGYQWHPWMWSRTGDPQHDGALGRDAATAWHTLFKPIADDDGVLAGSGRLEAADLSARDVRILTMAVATRHVFRPVDAIERESAAYRSTLGWPPPGVPVLGLHVRRGDAASAEPEGPVHSTRPSFALSEYLDAADRVCARYGIRHIFMASESEVEIARARERRPQYTFLSLPHDRALFPMIGVHPQHYRSQHYIEHAALRQPERIRALLMSAIHDLRVFCECTAFVGAFNSEFSVLGWLLATGSQGHIIPYVSLSRPAARMAWHPHDALLNVRNNCPLELYHW